MAWRSRSAGGRWDIIKNRAAAAALADAESTKEVYMNKNSNNIGNAQVKPPPKRKRDRDSKLFAYTSQRYTWSYDQICKASPVKLNGNASDHWRLMLEMFKAGDIVWTGDLKGCGKPDSAANFRTVREWLAETAAPAPFISSSSFKSGSISRCDENIVARRFLVVAPGRIDENQIGSVFMWLTKEMNLTLRAVVDANIGVLQAWFDRPAAKVEDKLWDKLAELDIWPRLIARTKPCCLPNGEDERLIYLRKKS